MQKRNEGLGTVGVIEARPGLARMSSLRARSPGQSPTLPLSHLPDPILPSLLPTSPNSTHVLVSALLPTTQTQAAL